uniref:Pyrroline-5-carboxylate reductase n=1 Tax=Kalanchoe fedtschenkoi TaxID=63787 RepID=A0A7N0UNR7_KALFE
MDQLRFPAAADQDDTTSYTYRLLVKLMSKRRIWVCLFILVYGLLLSFSLNLITWCTSSSPSGSGAWQAVYASVMLGAVFGLVSMGAALALALPSMLVTWITILVLLTFFGKPRRALVVEGRKITLEIGRFAVRVLVKEGNLVAATCAVVWYFALSA